MMILLLLETLWQHCGSLEDEVTTFSIDDLLLGYDDNDDNDVLTVQSPTAYKVVDGVTTDEIIGSFTPIIVDDVVLSYSYLPAANFVGDLEVTFVVSDSKGPGVGGSATLNISPLTTLLLLLMQSIR